jgi:hypothetical protein
MPLLPLDTPDWARPDPRQARQPQALDSLLKLVVNGGPLPRRRRHPYIQIRRHIHWWIPLTQLQWWCWPVDSGIEDLERGNTVRIRRLPAARPYLGPWRQWLRPHPKFYHQEKSAQAPQIPEQNRGKRTQLFADGTGREIGLGYQSIIWSFAFSWLETHNSSSFWSRKYLAMC